MDCEPLPGYLNLTLTPFNPILHTTRVMTLFKDYVPGKTVYKTVPLFYEEWSDETTELLFKCDAEVHGLCHELNDFDLSEVKSLAEFGKTERLFRFRGMPFRFSGTLSRCYLLKFGLRMFLPLNSKRYALLTSLSRQASA